MLSEVKVLCLMFNIIEISIINSNTKFIIASTEDTLNTLLPKKFAPNIINKPFKPVVIFPDKLLKPTNLTGS